MNARLSNPLSVVVDFAAYKAAREARPARAVIEPRHWPSQRRLPSPRQVAHRQRMLAYLLATLGPS